MAVFVDVETTGLDPVKCGIISIGAVASETGNTFYGECYVNYGVCVEPKVLEVNGFTPHQIYDLEKQSSHDLYAGFLAFCVDEDDKLLAGTNVGTFDVPFLKKYNIDIWPFGYHYIDVHSIAHFVLNKSLSLRKICVELGIDPEPMPHNALNGARKVLEVWLKLKTAWGCGDNETKKE